MAIKFGRGIKRAYADYILALPIEKARQEIYILIGCMKDNEIEEFISFVEMELEISNDVNGSFKSIRGNKNDYNLFDDKSINIDDISLRVIGEYLELHEMELSDAQLQKLDTAIKAKVKKHYEGSKYFKGIIASSKDKAMVVQMSLEYAVTQLIKQ